ncbi:MAG: hypothetical protein LBK42_10970 [Propionibacteriaceae bacterium]|nr:hypothetical protein [Propionibacteriaceae bacterium]
MELQVAGSVIMVDEDFIQRGKLSESILCDRCNAKGTTVNASAGVDFSGPQLVACSKCAGKGAVVSKGIVKNWSDITSYLEEPYEEVKPILAALIKRVATLAKEEYAIAKPYVQDNSPDGQYWREKPGSGRTETTLSFFITQEAKLKVVNIEKERSASGFYFDRGTTVLAVSVDEVLLEFDFEFCGSGWSTSWMPGDLYGCKYLSYALANRSVFFHEVMTGVRLNLSITQNFAKGYGLVKTLLDACTTLHEEEIRREKEREKAERERQIRIKREEAEAKGREVKRRQSESWRSQGLCAHCGGRLGLFKRCKICGGKY